ncbi:MAG: DUF2207 domain-containing protein [Muribaculaceae bacterium]|nr:DUF2207 domain-containing protein [Muribaculaceae bacterium]
MKHLTTQSLRSTLMALWLAMSSGFAFAHTLYDVDIQVMLNDQGHARVIETRSYSISAAGTEAYIKMYNLGVMEVGELAVSDERGHVFEVDRRWDEDRSRGEKALRCGIYQGEGGPELCWGIGAQGRRTYVVRYTLTRMVQSYDDYDGFSFHFFDASTPYPEHVRVTISKQDGAFTHDNTRIWSFGHYGTKDIIDGKIVAETTEPLLNEHEKVTVTARFEKGMFHPVTDVKGIYTDKLLKQVFKGSDYNIEDVERYDKARKQSSPGGEGYDPKRSTWLEMLDGLGDLAGIIAWLIAPFLLITGIFSSRSNFKRDYQLNRLFGVTKAESQQWSRDIPLEGDLNHAKAVLDTVGRTTTARSHQMGAYILRMVHQGRLTVQRQVDQKGNLERVIQIANPGPPPLEKGRHSEDQIMYLLQRFMWNVAGDDHVLQPKELQTYAKQFPVEHRAYVQQLKRGLNDLPSLSISRITPQDANAVFGLKKFLQEFTLSGERKIDEVSIWKEYLVYATLFGIADEVAKNLKKVWPLDVRTTLDDLLETVTTGTLLTTQMNRAVTYIERYETPAEREERLAAERAARESSSGGGGHSSYGGGGGSSGGGGSGIR